MWRMLVLILTFAFFYSSCQQNTKHEAELLLEKSIAYHDPGQQWNNYAQSLLIQTGYADGRVRNISVEFKNADGYFRYMEKDSLIDMKLAGDSCQVLGEKTLNCDRTKRWRNYILYVWGVPMKLKDPGTVIEKEISEETFNGYDCQVIKVIYPEDTWYFYIDKSNYALRGKKFYKDEPNNKGEVLTYEGEVNANGIIFPEKINWENTHDSLYLGADTLVEFGKLD